MRSNNNGGKPVSSNLNHSLFGGVTGSGVVWAQVTLKTLDDEMAKLEALDSTHLLLVAGARMALTWLRDGGLGPAERIEAMKCLNSTLI